MPDEVKKADEVDNSEANKKATEPTPAEEVAKEQGAEAKPSDTTDWKAEHDKLKDEIAKRDKSDSIKAMTSRDDHGAYQELLEKHLNNVDNPANEYSAIMKGIQSYNYKHQDTNKGALSNDPRSGMADRIKAASDEYDNARR